MILTMTPSRLDRNYGRACNEAMERLRSDDVAVFLDHDATFMTIGWQAQLEAAYAFDPTALFTCVTNRIAAPWQRAQEVSPDEHDMAVHSRVALVRMLSRSLLDITETKGFGGVLMMLSKASWQAAGGFVDGMFCVDHQMHYAMAALGRRVYVIEGLYVYHRRRAFGHGMTESGPDAPVKVRCACRGIETQPTRRVQLPEAVAC